MFKRFINWLIHKLGGYTEEEFRAMNDIANATAEAAQKMDTPIEHAKALKAYCKSIERCALCDFTSELGEECPLSGKRPFLWSLKKGDKTNDE